MTRAAGTSHSPRGGPASTRRRPRPASRMASGLPLSSSPPLEGSSPSPNPVPWTPSLMASSLANPIPTTTDSTMGLQGNLEALLAQVLSRITEMKENVLREEEDEAMRKLELFLDDNYLIIHKCAAEAALMRELEASLSQGCSHP